MSTQQIQTKKLSHMAIMLALGVVLAFTSIRIPPNPAITIAFLPAVVLAIIDGPLYAFIVGIGLGITSMIINITMPESPFSPYFANPLVSILPRSVIGVGAYYAYALVKKLFRNKATKTSAAVSAAVAGCVGAAINTILVLGAIYFLYGKDVSEMLAASGEGTTVLAALWAIAISNGLLEIAVNGVLCCAIIVALQSETRYSHKSA